MAVVISEITTEFVVAARPDGRPASAASGTGPLPDDLVEAVIRQATERVLEILRREWDR